MSAADDTDRPVGSDGSAQHRRPDGDDLADRADRGSSLPGPGSATRADTPGTSPSDSGFGDPAEPVGASSAYASGTHAANTPREAGTSAGGSSVADAAAEAERALAQAARDAEQAVRDAHSDGTEAVEKGFADAQRATERAYEEAASRSDRPG